MSAAAGVKALGSVLGKLLRGLLVLLLAVVTLVASALWHLDHPLTERVVLARLNPFLGTLFLGELEIRSLGKVHVLGIEGASAVVRDPEGQVVIEAEEVNAELSVAALLAGLGLGEIRLTLPAVSAGRAQLRLLAGADGQPSLARTFLLREPGPPSDQPSTLHLVIEAVRLQSLRVESELGLPLRAELAELALKVQVLPDDIQVDLGSGTIATVGMPSLGGVPAELNAALRAHLGLPSASGAELGIQAEIDGSLGGVPLQLAAALDGSRVDAKLTVRDDKGARTLALAPMLPQPLPIDIEATAHGDLNDRIDLSARLSAAEQRAQLTGNVKLQENGVPRSVPELEVQLMARDIDLSQIAPDAPKSRLGVEGDATIALGSPPTGRYRLQVLEGVLDGQPIPAIDLSGELLADDNKTTPVLTARATVHEPGAVTTLSARLEDLDRVKFSVQTASINLASQRRIPRDQVRGTAAVTAHGTVRLASRELVAQAQVRAHDLTAAGVHIGDATLNIDASGSLTAPDLALRLSAENVQLPNGAKVAQATARTHVALPQVGGSIAPRLWRTELLLGDEVEVHVAEVDLARGLRVRGASVRGFGAPIEAEISARGNSLVVKANARELEIERLLSFAEALGLVPSAPHEPLLGGLADLDVDLKIEGQTMSGHAQLDGRKLAALGVVEDGALHLRADLRGDSVDVDLSIREPQLAEVDAKIRALRPRGAPLSPASWVRAAFVADLDGKAELATVLRRIPGVPLDELSGSLMVSVRAQRDHDDPLPQVSLSAKTSQLALLSGQLRSAGTDVQLVASLLAHQLRLVLTASDADGTVLATELQTALPSAWPVELAALGDHPFALAVYMPRRPIAKLPPALQLGMLPGRSQLALRAWGTLHKPHLNMELDVRGLDQAQRPRAVGERRRGRRRGALDVIARGRYDGEQARLSLMAAADGRSVLDAQLELEAKVHDLLTNQKPFWERAWRASARVAASDLPLEWLPGLSDTTIQGSLGGELRLERYHDDARLKAAFEVSGLRSGAVRYEKARIDASIEAGSAKVKLGLGGPAAGDLQLTASAPVDWGKEMAPTLATAASAELALTARKFRLGGLQPFLSKLLYQLDGVLDGEMKLRAAPQLGRLNGQGELTFSDGTVQLPAVSDEFHDVSFVAKLREDGMLTIEDLGLSPAEGRIYGSAWARMSGLSFVGAEAKFRIPKGNSVELGVAGLSLEQVHGETVVRVQPELAADRSIQKIKIEVSVPSLNVELPGIPSASVQSLGRLAHVRVGTQGSSQRFRELPMGKRDLKGEVAEEGGGGIPMQAVLDLRRVEAAVGNLAAVRLRGTPVIAIDQETTMSGQIQLQHGFLDLSGKKFDIESGVVTFAGADPSNPTVVARAVWVAPDGTRVIAEYVGPVKSGKVNLRSEPPLSQDEIMGLLLFGSQEGAKDSGGQLAGSVGNTLPDGLGQAVTGLTGLKTQARIDTSTRNPRPEVQIQISDTVSIGFMTVLGTPPVSEPDRNFGRFAWRFSAHWSLVATIGDRYSTLLDAIWQYRY